MDSNFTFLKGEFDVIYLECEKLDKFVAMNENKEALKISRGIAEEISKEICKKQGKIEYAELEKQFDRLKYMENDYILNDDDIRKFHEIRIEGNKASHDLAFRPSDDLTKRIHRLVFEIASYFYLEYTRNPYPKRIPKYKKPVYDQDAEKLKLFDEFLEMMERKNLLSEQSVDINQIIDDIKREVLDNQENEREALFADFVEMMKRENLIPEQTIDIDKIIEEATNEISRKIIQKQEDDEKEKDPLENYKFTKAGNSYLIGELTKLRNSSREAVEGSEGLDDFKDYLHVERGIQKELLEKIRKVSEIEGQHIIMLCGSVGDGKSHLLGYLNKEYPDLMSRFTQHNDATESNSPGKTAIETLQEEVLKSFNDENFNNNDEKLILLINLGVLNNFMESDYAKMHYKHLVKILNDMDIFNQDNIRDIYEQEQVSIISFSDYNLFEFDEHSEYMVKSDYLQELFDRITSEDENNYFYRAYLMDKRNKLNSPVIHNYEIISNPKAQKSIINIIIKVIIKYKVIVSTREVLNFIYEIMVPSEIVEYDETYSLLDYTDDLLMNLLFNTTERGELLRYINLEDPVNKRHEKTDKIIVNLNILPNARKVLSEYMDCADFESFFNELGKYDNIQSMPAGKEKLIETILRLLNIFGNKGIMEIFTKKSYEDYLNYLYGYNINDEEEIISLGREIRNAVFNWKGQMKKHVIIINDLDGFKVGEKLKMIVDTSKIKDYDNHLGNRFKTSIKVSFIINKKKVRAELNIDYQLYEIITKLNRGYRPNKTEQRSLLLFKEFINQIIDLGNSNRYLVHKPNGDKFTFEYDEEVEKFYFEEGEA